MKWFQCILKLDVIYNRFALSILGFLQRGGREVVKDLLGLGRDLKWVVIVDGNLDKYEFQPMNALSILPFTNDDGNTELERMIKFLEGSDGFEDMREAMKQYMTVDPYNKTLI